jgi:hypothetical protein
MSPEAILSAIVHDILELRDLVDDPQWDAYSAAGLWRIDPSTYWRIAEALRPVAADFPSDTTSE